MRRLFALAVLFALTLICPRTARCDDFYEAQLNRGITESEVHSAILIRQAGQAKADSDQERLLMKALLYSPDLPSVYFALSRAEFTWSGDGILNSVDYIIQGVDAYSRNFWWTFTAAGGLFFDFLLSLLLAVALVVLLRIVNDVSLLGHDIKEANLSSYLVFLLIPLSAVSPLLFLGGALVLVGLYMKKMDRAVVYLVLLFLLLSPLFLKAATYFVGSASSAALKAVVDVNESKGNEYAVSILKDRDDYMSRFSYGLALKRDGQYEKAIGVFQQLIAARPDPKCYVNLGNCYVGLYDFSDENKEYLGEALHSYLAAVDLKPLVSAYYNLSQVSRELLDFTKGDEYFRKALAINRTAVSSYRAVFSRSPNRFVADETLAPEDFWRFAGMRSSPTARFGIVAFPPLVLSLASCLLAAAFFLQNRRRRGRAFRCRKCTTILCPQCEKRLMWGQMCPQCYASLIKLDESDVKERVARILSIYGIQKKRRNMLKLLSFILPGLPQIFAGKVLYGFLLLWLFLFLVLLPVTATFLTPAGGIVVHSVFSLLALIAAALVYGITHSITKKRIAKGWL